MTRRSLLSGALSIPLAFADQLKGGIKLTMPAPDLSDESLNFIVRLGVQWVTTSGPGGPTYNEEGRVIRRPGDTAEAPWKEDEIRALKTRVESFGLKAGNLMLHDIRDVVLGRPDGDRDIERASESIRVAGKVGIPVVEYNWYALRAMGGYYQEPGRGGVRLAAHDYERSRNLPTLPDVGEHSAAQLWDVTSVSSRPSSRSPSAPASASPSTPTTRPSPATAESSRSLARWMASSASATSSAAPPTGSRSTPASPARWAPT